MSVARRAKVLVRGLAPLGVVRLIQRRRNRWRRGQQERFDARHGVDTAGYLYPEQMQVDEESRTHGSLYEATWRGSVKRMIRSLEIDTARRTFIDIGSGKGAVLLYASEFPFRRVIGVEHEPTLHAVAEANIETWLDQPRSTMDITSVCTDALTYELPDEPLVLYFANPFDAESSRIFFERLRASLDASPRPIDIITFNRWFENVVDEAAWLERTGKGWNHASYRTIA